MEEGTENLERKIREKFFEEKEYTREATLKLIDKVADLATINPKTGEVYIVERRLTIGERVGLVVVARFLGNQINDKINPEVTGEEVVKYVGVDKKQASARLNELVGGGLLKRTSPGVFRAKSLLSIEKWVNRLTDKYGERV